MAIAVHHLPHLRSTFNLPVLPQEHIGEVRHHFPSISNLVITIVGLAVHIMDYVQAHGRVTTRDMVREHKASPNTAKATFANLVKKGLLVRHGAGRSIWYGLS